MGELQGAARALCTAPWASPGPPASRRPPDEGSSPSDRAASDHVRDVGGLKKWAYLAQTHSTGSLGGIQSLESWEGLAPSSAPSRGTRQDRQLHGWTLDPGRVLSPVLPGTTGGLGHRLRQRLGRDPRGLLSASRSSAPTVGRERSDAARRPGIPDDKDPPHSSGRDGLISTELLLCGFGVRVPDGAHIGWPGAICAARLTRWTRHRHPILQPR